VEEMEKCHSDGTENGVFNTCLGVG